MYVQVLFSVFRWITRIDSICHTRYRSIFIVVFFFYETVGCEFKKKKLLVRRVQLEGYDMLICYRVTAVVPQKIRDYFLVAWLSHISTEYTPIPRFLERSRS